MTAFTVGAGLQFQTVAAAVAASHDGDTIYVKAGTYTNDGATINTKISIVGVGGLAHFVSTTPPANGKAIFVTNTDVTFDHVELSGTTVPDHNGAGIRYQAGHLTITNSYFHDNQDGILGAASSGGTVDIEASEFAHNGAGDGFSHNIYIGAIASLTITNSYIHDAVVGHEIKSRAATTVITNNRIFDNSGTASYSIDLPNGGAGVVRGNIIQQSANSQNPRYHHLWRGRRCRGQSEPSGRWQYCHQRTDEQSTLCTQHHNSNCRDHTQQAVRANYATNCARVEHPNGQHVFVHKAYAR